MKKNTLRIIWWAAVLFYVTFIYSTLNIAPSIADKLDAFLSGRLDLMLYAVYSAVIGVLVLYILLVRKQKSVLKYFVLTFAVCGFFAVINYAQTPAEKIHLGEYGLLGILLYNALKIEFNRFDFKLYIYAVVMCTAIGVIDEVIQGILPNRFFDWRDIFMNAISGALPLLVIRINILKKQ